MIVLASLFMHKEQRYDNVINEMNYLYKCSLSSKDIIVSHNFQMPRNSILCFIVAFEVSWWEFVLWFSRRCPYWNYHFSQLYIIFCFFPDMLSCRRNEKTVKNAWRLESYLCSRKWKTVRLGIILWLKLQAYWRMESVKSSI